MQWIESSGRDIVKDVPQNPAHHPEGNVDHHTFMVRSSLPFAISQLQQAQAQDPDGPFSNLNLELTPTEQNVLRLAAWAHDIGKAVTTDPVKLTAYGHDDRENVEKAMQKLPPDSPWIKMYNQASPADLEAFWFVVENHMKMTKAGGGIEDKSLIKQMMDYNGKYKNETKVKLLLLIFLMDTRGRGGLPDFNREQRKDFVAQNHQPGWQRIQQFQQMKAPTAPPPGKTPATEDPTEFVNLLRSKNLHPSVIFRNLKNKRPDLTDDQIQQYVGEHRDFESFFMEEPTVQPKLIDAQIPVPEDVYLLKRLFQQNGFQLKVVGGAVRDFLMWQHEAEELQAQGKQPKPYEPKDVDLATDATPREMARMLDQAGISNFEKGESFGVWVAHLNGENYEIATFREDVGGSDGRRPDKVIYTRDAAMDHRRRDLTMNGLYYDIPESPGNPGQITDYTGGQALEDIKNKQVRFIGDPFARIGEDKLRVPRAVRFHSRYNDGDMMSTFDPRTLDAIGQFKDLRAHGISGERIQQEFLAGLQKAKNVVSYLKNYEASGLMPAVFPGLTLDMAAAERLSDQRNPILVLALLLRNNDPMKTRTTLNKLNWPNDVTDEVEHLLTVWQSAKSGTLGPKEAMLTAKKPDRRGHVQQFGQLLGSDVDPVTWGHYGEYQPLNANSPGYSGEEIMQQHGVPMGPLVGQKQREMQKSAFDTSFKNYVARRQSS